MVMTQSKNARRFGSVHRILDDFRRRKPEVYEEVLLIRRCLLTVTVTWNEKALQYIADALEHYHHRTYEKMRDSLQRIVKLVNKPPLHLREMYIRFKEKNENHIQALDQLLKHFNPTKQTWIDKSTVWRKYAQETIGEEQKQIRIIQMSAISPELCSRTGFNLAVPGTYRPGTPPNRIKYFVGQFSVYMSKQQPKDVVVRGYDGNFYQYLLKGHEDLRLDERILQFFRLINSLVRKEDCFNGNVIGTVCVIPLSPFHGLVQWIPGTKTLRNVLEQYRRLHRRERVKEYELTADFGTLNYDFL
jgi:phosphatidylinositol kinase/protein kinase (PI-3  family)